MKKLVTIATDDAERIRKRREELGLSMRSLAGRAEMSLGYLHKVEKGNVKVGAKVVEALAKALGVLPGWIVGQPVSLEDTKGGMTPIAFAGEAAKEADGTRGNHWLRLLWKGALLVASHPGPGPDGLQAALRTVSSAAQAARKYVPADRIGGEEDAEEITDEKTFLAELGEELEPMLERAGWPEEQRRAVRAAFETMKGGDA